MIAGGKQEATRVADDVAQGRIEEKKERRTSAESHVVVWE